jgi:hypothetical protein
MAPNATIEQSAFYQSLQKLEALAKSNVAAPAAPPAQQSVQQPPVAPQPVADPQAAVQAQVTAGIITEKLSKGMPLTDEEQALVKAQICTGSGNEPQSWPGGTPTHHGDGWTDDIKPDGTDYNQRGVRKSIMEKVAKGIPLEVHELQLLHGDISKSADPAQQQATSQAPAAAPQAPVAAPQQPQQLDKSFQETAQQSQTLRQGVEVSEFLAELTKAVGAGFEGLEARTNARIEEFAGRQGEFNKSLADAVVNIGRGFTSVSQQVDQVAQLPVGAPRSQMVAQPQQVPQQQQMAKAFGGQMGGGIAQQPMLQQFPAGYTPSGPQPQFAQRSFGPQTGQQTLPGTVGRPDPMILNQMTELAKSGTISGLEVIKYESTGDINPALLQQIQTRMSGIQQ